METGQRKDLRFVPGFRTENLSTRALTRHKRPTIFGFSLRVRVHEWIKQEMIPRSCDRPRIKNVSKIAQRLYPGKAEVRTSCDCLLLLYKSDHLTFCSRAFSSFCFCSTLDR